jgi:3-oxoacyl-[acyl-carrier protein] reductase
MAIEGKVVVVTGAASGIGRALTIALNKDKAHVVGFDVNNEGLQETAAACENRMLAAVGDVAVEADVDRLVSAAIERFERIDILINNAGIADGGGLMFEEPFEKWRRVIEINLIGVGLCTHRILPGMLERGYGRIINVASRGAQSTASRASGYAASKAAVVSFTKNIANTIDREKYPDVLVNAIIPGITKTNIWSRAFESGFVSEDFLARFQEPEAVYPHTRFIVDLPSNGPSGRTFFYGEDYPIFSRFNL